MASKDRSNTFELDQQKKDKKKDKKDGKDKKDDKDKKEDKDNKKSKTDRSCRPKSSRKGEPTDPNASALTTKRESKDKGFSSHDEVRQFFKTHDSVDYWSFDSKKIIGCGSFGMVSLVLFGKKKCVDGVRLPPFCLKSVDKGRILGLEQIHHVTSEFEILKLMANHPNVVQLYGAFHDQKYVHYITEFIPGGELFQRIYPPEPGPKPGLPIDAARFYFSEVVSVFEFMHERNIVYRDLKPENVLIASSGHIKIVDFGFAKDLNKTPGGRTSTICGTMEYLAPEMAQAHLISSKDLSSKRPIPTHQLGVDLWALGIFLYELCNARSPFAEYAEDPNEICKAIMKVRFTMPESMDPACADLIKRCLRKDPSNRIGGPNHPIHLHSFISEDSNKNSILWDDVVKNSLTPPWKPRLRGHLDSSKFKQPVLDEIRQFGATIASSEHQARFAQVFGPMQKTKAATFEGAET